jgi:hypothetical protein
MNSEPVPACRALLPLRPARRASGRREGHVAGWEEEHILLCLDCLQLLSDADAFWRPLRGRFRA